MASVDVDERLGDIVITSEHRERELCRMVPGVKWDNSARAWRVPLSWASCLALRGVFRDGLIVGPGLNAWAQNERASRVDPAMALRNARDCESWVEALPALYPFQRAGAAFLATAGSALMADEMGLGKTVEAISAVRALGAWPMLVVCPNSVKRTWANELARWAPDVSVTLVGGSAAARRKAIADFRATALNGPAALVINWEALRLHSRIAGFGSIRLSEGDQEPKELNEIEWGAVIADEAHRAKEPQAKQTRALWGVAQGARHRFALTGTPIANSPDDLWSVMHFVSPFEWPAKTRWLDRYGLLSYNPFGGIDVVGIKAETRDELFGFLDPRFIRRTKEAVLPELPEKTYSKRYVELAPKQQRAYNSLRKHMLVMLEDGTLIASHPLQRVTRLLQFASAYAEIDEDGNVSLAEPSCKLDALDEVIEEAGGRQLVVFAESRQLIELAAMRLTKSGVPHALVTGQVGEAERGLNVEAFQRGDTQVLLLTMGAGGEGLTLTAADTAVFLQRSFSSVKNLQAEDRIHRIGQEHEAITIIDIISEDTVESRVHEAMLDKAARLEEIARDADTLREWLA